MIKVNFMTFIYGSHLRVALYRGHYKKHQRIVIQISNPVFYVFMSKHGRHFAFELSFTIVLFWYVVVPYAMHRLE